MKPIYLFLIFGFVLSLLFSSGQIENPDTHLRLTQTRILIQEHSFGLPIDVGEDTHGNIAINNKGQRYMVYNPGQTIVFIPVYYISKFFCSDDADAYYFSAFCVSFVNFIIHALCAFFLFKIALLLGASKRQAFLSSAFFGLTSYSFVFAQSTYEHHFEMLFILMGMFYALKKQSNYAGLLSGLMLSLGLVFRTTAILAAPAILLMQNENKARFRFLLSLSLGIFFVLLYNSYRFGSPFESGYSLAWSLAQEDKFSKWSILQFPVAVFGFLFSPGKGLIFFSPTILIAFLGIRSFWMKNRMMFYSIMLIFAAYIGLFSLNFAWHGSIWSFGPRYILPVVPFLYLPIMYIKPKRIYFLIMLVAFIFQVELIAVNYKRNVLEEFVKNNGISDLEYLYSIDKIPYYVQAKQLYNIVPKNFKKLNNYQPNSPWKKEIRTASNKEVLKSSIEKNAINFWWVRVYHWKLSVIWKVVSVSILIFGLMGLIIIFWYVRKKII